MHFGVLLSHLPPLASGPDHKSVHRPLYPVGVVLVVLVHHLNVVVVWGRGGGHLAARAVRQSGRVLG